MTFRAGRVFGTPTGPSDYAQYAEFEFSEMDAFKRGMSSDEMKAVVEDAQTQGMPFHVHFVEVA